MPTKNLQWRGYARIVRDRLGWRYYMCGTPAPVLTSKPRKIAWLPEKNQQTIRVVVIPETQYDELLQKAKVFDAVFPKVEQGPERFISAFVSECVNHSLIPSPHSQSVPSAPSADKKEN